MEDAPLTETAPELNPTHPARPAHLAALARERNLRRDQRRAARQADGRCPYCGRYSEPGHTACPRCRERQRERNQALLARRRAAREDAARCAAPRRCNHCESPDLIKKGLRHDRPYYNCRACGRYSNGDGPPPPKPAYPCPYCKGQCWRSYQRTPTRTIYYCPACRRQNTNLYPADAPSPGGPFPHRVGLCLDYAAKTNLMDYLQAKGMSQPQAIRDIFTRAATAPLGYVSRATSSRPFAQRYERFHANDDWDDDVTIVSVPLPPPPPPAIPPGGIALPDLRPEASHKFAAQSGDAHRRPTVLNLQFITVNLNDAALAGLLATMQRRSLNHQDAARALLAEAKP